MSAPIVAIRADWVPKTKARSSFSSVFESFMSAPLSHGFAGTSILLREVASGYFKEDGND